MRNSIKRIRELERELAAVSRRNRELEHHYERVLDHMEKIGISSTTFSEDENKDKSDSRVEMGDVEHLTETSSLPFFQSMFERSSWLSGLLIFQSFSTLILSSNQHVLEIIIQWCIFSPRLLELVGMRATKHL